MPWGQDGGAPFARAALALYDLPADSELKLVSLSENATFLVKPTGSDQYTGVMRIYRPNYQTEGAKRSEIAWIEELRASGVVDTPAPIYTSLGSAIGEVEIDGDRRSCSMFEYIPGREFEGEDSETYELLGRISATLHLQVLDWEKPDYFERMRWGLEDILGEHAPWGDWRNGPNLSVEDREVLEQVEQRIRERLADYDLNAENSNLVHGDMRAANVMKGEDGRLWLIDFDDAGFGWFLWDLCSTTLFIEHLPEIGDIVQSWLDGYTGIRELRERDLAAIPDLVMMRRLHGLAWIGSHPESALAQEQALVYPQGTVEIGRRYLRGEYLAGVGR